jgi:hypothetical protein
MAGLDISKSDLRTQTRVKQTLSDIDGFLTVLTGISTPETAPSATERSANSAKAPAAGDTTESKTSPKPNAAPKAAPASTSHLNAVLSADGLAQKLGVNIDTGILPDAGVSQHILLIQALESGGAVTQHTNIFGTTVRYSGGAVGTYALFTTDGDLECSGNVYEYAGAFNSKEFQEKLRHYHPEPGKQMIFLRGGCAHR